MPMSSNTNLFALRFQRTVFIYKKRNSDEENFPFGITLNTMKIQFIR